jgi:hypothetical protein
VREAANDSKLVSVLSKQIDWTTVAAVCMSTAYDAVTLALGEKNGAYGVGI